MFILLLKLYSNTKIQEISAIHSEVMTIQKYADHNIKVSTETTCMLKKFLNSKSPNKVVSKSEEFIWQQDEQTVEIMLKLTMQSLLHKLPWKVKDIVVKQYNIISEYSQY